MRVLHILGELKRSGAEAMYRAAAELWRREGLECEILSTGETVGSYAPALEAVGYRIHHIPFSPSGHHVRDVYRFLRKRRYDVVHVNGERASFWYALAARMVGTRRIFRTVHNVFPFRGRLRLERMVQRSISRTVLRVKTIAISRSVLEMERGRFRNPALLIPNWFDSETMVPPTPSQRDDARRLLGIPRDVTVLSSVGGCWSYKSHPAILRSLESLHGGARLLYLHVGQENPQSEERALARALGVDGLVRFLGVVPDVLPVLHASDIFLMPSDYEGFGCAAAEAMGAGLPTVLSRAPGLRDFEGLCPDVIWSDPTPESIAGGLARLLDFSLEQRREIDRRLSACAHLHFGLDGGARAYARLYHGNRIQPAPASGCEAPRERVAS